MERVILVGSPNSGKTTLFNWLTGQNQKTVNYPGSTIEIVQAKATSKLNVDIEFFDSPGAYSLNPKSDEEEVTRRALVENPFGITKAVVVLDAVQLDRQKNLLKEIEKLKMPIVVAVTMWDELTPTQQTKMATEIKTQIGHPVVFIKGNVGEGVEDLAKVVSMATPSDRKLNPSGESWQSKGHPLDRANTDQKDSAGDTYFQKWELGKLQIFERTEKLDKILFHPFFGPVLFFAIMSALFSSIYWFAAPFMDAIEVAFSWLADLSTGVLGASLWSEFVSVALVGGMGSVLVFVPQIFILFLGIAILEDSGFLARASGWVDKPLSKIGLNGKAFVPLLSGFACAVPAMMATRSMNSKRERWIANFILPLMTCSARLPVYGLLIGFLFFGNALVAGLVMAGLYLGGIVVAVVAAAILDKMLVKKHKGFFLQELPLLRNPKMVSVFRSSFRRTKSYVMKTGPIILVLSMVLWALTTFPKYDSEDQFERLSGSYASQAGKWIEPVFEPMGADWRVGIGLISAFAAREVFVSSIAVMFHVTSEDEQMESDLLTQMANATKADGSKLFTAASVAALLVFFMIALQCISTSAVAVRETGSKGFAIIQMVVMNLVAYGAAVLTYQLLS
jgi:ferrous iron transport protein B